MTPIRDLKKCQVFITPEEEKGLRLLVKEWVLVGGLFTRPSALLIWRSCSSSAVVVRLDENHKVQPLTEYSVAFRPLRPLCFAMGPHGNIWEFLHTPKSSLRDPFQAMTLLEKYWPAHLNKKEYFWPNDHDEGRGPDFGDVGVFETIHPPKFRKLTNIKDDLPTYLFVGNEKPIDLRVNTNEPPPSEDCQLIGPFTYRRVPLHFSNKRNPS